MVTNARRRFPCHQRPSHSTLFVLLPLVLLATLVSSSRYGNRGGGSDGGHRQPPTGRYYRDRDDGNSRDGRGYEHNRGHRYDENDQRLDVDSESRRSRDRFDDVDSWGRPLPPMPEQPPPPPPPGQDTGSSRSTDGNIMGGYGQSTPLPGAPPPPGTTGMQDQPGIHYNFPSTEYVDKQYEKETKKRGGMKGGNEADAGAEADYGFVPNTELPPMRSKLPNRGDAADGTAGSRGDGPRWADPDGRGGRGRANDHATARRDAVQIYISAHRLGRIQIMSSSALIGYGAGTFLGKSMMNSAHPLAPILAGVFALLTVLRNHYGELSKALGLGLIMTAGRLGKVRKSYPTGPHLKAMLSMGQREPFPPIFSGRENVWRYKVRDGYEGIDPDFNMMRTAVAMAMIGGFCGGNFPLIPAWIGGTAGAVALAFGTTLRGPKGDLYRTMGMRVVALMGEMLDVFGELGLARKGGYTAGKIFDRMLFLDRKHGIRKKVGAGISFVVERVSRTANEVKADMDDSDDEYDGRGRRNRARTGRHDTYY
mmetsp:Transcript_12309/g.25474  ORF Transcript_12309/g.25474 Transcript_12309/m.25474 type:complete len:537 (+) Transcript_12309:152-1762(+)